MGGREERREEEERGRRRREEREKKKGERKEMKGEEMLENASKVEIRFLISSIHACPPPSPTTLLPPPLYSSLPTPLLPPPLHPSLPHHSPAQCWHTRHILSDGDHRRKGLVKHFIGQHQVY